MLLLAVTRFLRTDSWKSRKQRRTDYISVASWIEGSHCATARTYEHERQINTSERTYFTFVRTSSDAWWSSGRRNISFLFSSFNVAFRPAVSLSVFMFTGSRLRKINGRCSSIVAGGVQHGGEPVSRMIHNPRSLRWRYAYLVFHCREVETQRDFSLRLDGSVVPAEPFLARHRSEFYLDRSSVHQSRFERILYLFARLTSSFRILSRVFASQLDLTIRVVDTAALHLDRNPIDAERWPFACWSSRFLPIGWHGEPRASFPIEGWHANVPLDASIDPRDPSIRRHCSIGESSMWLPDVTDRHLHWWSVIAEHRLRRAPIVQQHPIRGSPRHIGYAFSLLSIDCSRRESLHLVGSVLDCRSSQWTEESNCTDTRLQWISHFQDR